MILLTDVATKLEELLNAYSPSDYSFVVKSAGYHLDSISNKKKARNQIPVFVSLVGGEYNPVPNLKETNYTFEVNIYYPVRFKEDFYNINPYLSNLFVGKKLSFGSDNALCNISVAEYGEIIDFDAIREFENWVEEQFNGAMHLFKKEEQVNEFYMSMRFRLFATKLGEGFMLGNDVKYLLNFETRQRNISSLKMFYQGEVVTATRYASGDTTGYYAWQVTLHGTSVIYTDVNPQDAATSGVNFVKYITNQVKFYVQSGNEMEVVDSWYVIDPYYTETGYLYFSEELVFVNAGTGLNANPVAQQKIQVDSFAKNVINTTNYNKTMLIYPNLDTNFWKNFLAFYNIQDMSKINNLTLIKEYSNGMKFYYSQVILSVNENMQLGEPLSLTLTYGDKK